MSRYVKLSVIMVLIAFWCDLGAKNHCSNNNFSPTGRLTLTPEFCDGNVAVGLLGEAGNNNGRLNGTIGFAITPCQSFKIGGEYLTQKLKFHYHDGSSKRWVQQWAVGGKYRALFDHCFLSGAVFDFYYSRAESHSLKSHISNNNIYELKRRIAGSHAAGFEAGLIFKPWGGAELSLLADYDNVKFQRNYEKNCDINGFGLSAAFTQRLFSCLDLNLEGEWRKPFNNYSAELLYAGNNYLGSYTLGIFGGYTQGKSRLPNITTAGIQLGMSFGAKGTTCDPCCNCCFDSPASSALASWVMEPAVYMPLVMTVRDQKLLTICTPPTADYIPDSGDYVAIFIDQLVFDVSPYFHGDGLNWSIVSLDPGQATATISSNGIVTLELHTLTTGMFTLEVTANNACGSVSGLVFVSLTVG